MIIITPTPISTIKIPITTEPAFTTATVSGDLPTTLTITILPLTGCTTTDGLGEQATAAVGETNGEMDFMIHGIHGDTILTAMVPDMVMATILTVATVMETDMAAITVRATTIITTTASTTTAIITDQEIIPLPPMVA